MSSYKINNAVYTVRTRGLEEDFRVARRPIVQLIPFTSMLTIEYIPGEKIKITLLDKSAVYITVEEDNPRDNINLFELYRALC
jgi:hypothetical protein